MASSTIKADIPIAVVGLACRFPGDASTPSKFWDLLKSGKDAYSPTSSRWNSDAFYHPKSSRLNTLPTKGGHFLKQDPFVYDAAFFNITAAEAVALDPKQRIAMEVAYEALENADMSLQHISGSQTACYIGSGVSDYRGSIERDFMQAPKYHLLGTGEEMIANRISHFLNLHGPSATVATACSSSLMAAHLACQSIRSGESEMALTGGVGLILTPDFTTHLNNLSFLNPEGRSKAFDETAGGYGRGEGCGILVLKRLDAALRDGDNVRAVIRATGANSDGFTQGVTMPSLEAQAALIKYVYESHGLDYDSTQYVEAHGTGTKAGDPIETEAIYSTIGRGASKPRKLWVGSVKPNIGHLEAAAGVAGIIKGILAMEHGLIPPNLHFTKPNPALKFQEWNMAVPTKLTPWPMARTKRVSVSGFGMGGTNGHVVLEAFDNSTTPANGTLVNGTQVFEKIRSRQRLFVFSSHDQAGFKRNADALVEHLEHLGPTASSAEYLANLSHTLSGARARLSWRAACVAGSTAELHDYLTTKPGDGASRDGSARDSPLRIGYVFTGQGAQWARMGVEMLERPVFRASVSRSTEFLRRMGCVWDPVEELNKPVNESRLGQPELSQPICSVLQIALVDELRSWGVTPSKVVGHSSGEIAAAYSVGALSNRDAIAAAYFRGVASATLRIEAPELRGGMMAVGCSREEAEALIAEAKFPVGSIATVACVNSPSSVTLSGDVDALEQLRAVLDDRKVFARRLKVEMAYHSTHMNKVFGTYSSAIADIEPLEQAVDDEDSPIMVSSVTGEEVRPEVLGPYYWVRNLVSPVLFSDAVKELVLPDTDDDEDHDAATKNQASVDLLIEIGPHSALGGPVEQILAHHGINKVAYESMLTRGQNAVQTSLQVAANLFMAGVPLQLAQVNGDVRVRRLMDLPPYQWNHAKVFRHETRIQRELVTRKYPTQSILGAQMAMMDENQHVWRHFIRLEDEPWIRGHTVGSTVLFPAAGMVSMAIEAARQAADPEKQVRSLHLRDVSFFAAMALPEEIATEVILHLRPHQLGTTGSTPAAWWEFTVSSCVGTDQLRDNCRGLIMVDYVETTSQEMLQEERQFEIARLQDRRTILGARGEIFHKEAFYNQFLKTAWKYGTLFQGVEKIHLGDGESAYEVKMVDLGETYSKGQLDRPFLIHGPALDAIMQGSLGSTYKDGSFQFDKPLLPTFIGELDISCNIPGEVNYVLPCMATSKRHGFNALSANLFAFDDTLSTLHLSIRDFRLSELGNDSDKGDAMQVEIDPAEITSEIKWNYALDVMKEEEVSAVVSAARSEDRISKYIRMFIHSNPSAIVAELVKDAKALHHVAMQKFPKGTILPSQVKYALLTCETEIEKPADLLGDVFSLGEVGEPVPDVALADLLVITSEALPEQVLTRIISLAKPDATVVLSAPTVTGSTAANVLNGKGFQRILNIADNSSSTLAVYKHSHVSSNGASHDQEHLIIMPTRVSATTQDFSVSLLQNLRAEGHKAKEISWTALGVLTTDEIEGKAFVSLLELEHCMLSDLNESDFSQLKMLVLNGARLLWITGGDDPATALVDGFSRTIRNENASIKFQVLHLGEKGAATLLHGPALATRLATSATRDDEFREHEGLLQIGRIFNSLDGNNDVRRCLEDSVYVQPLKNENAEPVRLTIGKPGLLDTLRFIKDERMDVPLQDLEIEVDVKATGVNFKDVMASMGLVEVSLIGQEASGIVTAVGSKAADRFQLGDRVTTLREGMHANNLRIDHRLAVKIPDSMSFEEGASLPVVHATAYHALVNIAKLRPGQCVLIHAAAGGVGQAALQLSAHLGLKVYATVGSEDKRKLIMEKYNIPESHILHSRDASFVKAIQRLTGGRGVDCVLNSLSGELLRASWSCLAMFGTFVEIGLRDITNNMRLDMRQFGKSTTFTFINIANFFADHMDIAGQILQDTFDLVHKGALFAPSPLTVYPVEAIETAFRTMQQGKHRGKLVLSLDEDARAPVLRRARDALRLDPEGTYLIVGGLGGLGRSLAREFVASGARHIAFLSRSGAKGAEAQAVVAELGGRGASVQAYSADIADEASFRIAMEHCSRNMPPIRGVIQMAMVLRDVVFEKMSFAEWTAPLRPKVQGTWNLHRFFDATRPLDFFIICSSLSGVFGNASQAQYASGNAYQDALAQFRCAQGLKAVSVNLGIMRDVGVLAEQAENGDTHNLKKWEECLGIREPAFHALMKSLINRQTNGQEIALPAQICTGLGYADLILGQGLTLPYYFDDPRFGPLAATSITNSSGSSEDGAGASVQNRLAEAASTEQATGVILDALVQKVADILQMPASEVDAGRPMYRYGVDSLVALEVRNWIAKEMKANVALLEILAATPMNAFAGKIAEKSKLLESNTA